jgi:hypothetical protein
VDPRLLGKAGKKVLRRDAEGSETLWGTQEPQLPIMLLKMQYLQYKYLSSLLADGSLCHREAGSGMRRENHACRKRWPGTSI